MKAGIFCRTESVAMTLKIMCTYAHYITLGSRCKMASSHRVTNLEKNPVCISKDEAPTLLSVVGPLFISSLLFHLSRALLGAWRFSLFRSVQLLQQVRPHQGACLLLGVLFYFPNLSLFVSSYVKIKKFCSFQFNRLAISWPPWVRVWGWASYLFLPFTVFSLGLPFRFSSYIVHFYDVRVRAVVLMFNETPHSFFA